MGEILGGARIKMDSYFYFYLPITQQSVRQLLWELGRIPQEGRAHIAMYSPGGDVQAGIALYEGLRASPVPILVYAVGSVESIAVVAFMGAQERISTPMGQFMLHRVHVDLYKATVPILEEEIDQLRVAERRIDEILRLHIEFDDSAWAKIKTGDLYVSPDQALRAGIVHRISEFCIPKGERVIVI